ncbi:MAG: bifunctional 4-hydroxy-2-oxoglutarate aldolase/2-dehydro-3-deoxy-phosphogluconate aldolase [Firmicutes bacterium]|nr:bifunctional 4-hydroxy-2-oxoglutarate aldolase/2-dehydro-3-deoxy-phosphogluconate aldolase [Bacillota bacterium]
MPVNVELLQKEKIIAIIRGIPLKDMKKTGDALYKGGIRLMEVAFDHTSPDGFERTLNGLRLLRTALPEDVHLGAGTVLCEGEVQGAFEAGAEFIISPSTDPAVIRKTKELGMLSMPGAMTPTEIASAYQAGGDIIKLFPADCLGASYVKALRGPLGYIPLAAVGGISQDNIRNWQEAGIQVFGIGSSLVSASLVREGRFEELTSRALGFFQVLK